MEAKLDEEKWTVQGELGRGSFGSVYLLFHKPPYCQKFALKIIDEHGAGKGDREEARKELRIMRGLHHPHIVDLVDAFELEQQIHIVLELCDGGDLRTYLDQLRKRRGREKRPTVGVEESLVISWTKQLSSALTYLHHKRILHRDLKPQNIFLKDRYNLKVGDLGIARQLRFTLEMAATHIGTPLYISPEIYRGTPYSYKADIWSLGCCVYEMMALQCAFQAASRYEVMWKVVSKELGPVPTCYSVELQTLTVSMLHKDPEHRPSAADIHDAVQSMQQLQEQPPWEKKTSVEAPPARPSDATALQTWRQDMANALIKYLSQKHANHSAGLAELALRLSKGSIRGTDMSVALAPSRGGVSLESSRETSDGYADYHYSSDSFVGSESEPDLTVTLQSSSATVTGTEGSTDSGDFDSTPATQITRGVSRRSAFKVKHGPSPDVKRKKTSERSRHFPRGVSETDKGSDEEKSTVVNRPSVSGLEAHSMSVGDASERQEVFMTALSSHPADRCRSHENSHSGKQHASQKHRPLPHPHRHGEQEQGKEGRSSQSVAPPSPEEHSHTLSPSENSPEDLCFPLPHANQTDAQAAYAKEVMQWARAHLSSAEQMDVKTGDDGEPDEVMDAGRGGQADDDQVLMKGERVKRKKRNFLKERKNKHQGVAAAQEADTEPTTEDRVMEETVTLFTRGQRVSFAKEPTPPAEGSDAANQKNTLCRASMTRELGEATFQAALDAVVLLSKHPSLLELQMKEILGRENYKKYAAAIVECATNQQGGS